MSKAVRAMTMKSMMSVLFSLFFLLGFSLPAHAQTTPSKKVNPAGAGKTPTKQARPAEPEVKEVSGMSIMGNNDAPKSLYIVPWKSSELGSETEFKSSLLNEDLMPVDKPVFQRELDFHALSNSPPNSR
jgi:hypothetical protein